MIRRPKLRLVQSKAPVSCPLHRTPKPGQKGPVVELTLCTWLGSPDEVGDHLEQVHNRRYDRG